MATSASATLVQRHERLESISDGFAVVLAIIGKDLKTVVRKLSQSSISSLSPLFNALIFRGLSKGDPRSLRETLAILPAELRCRHH